MYVIFSGLIRRFLISVFFFFFSFFVASLILLYREVVENMMKAGEISARLKQTEMALLSAEQGKQEAESEAALAQERAELSKLEVKRIELMVIIGCPL